MIEAPRKDARSHSMTRWLLPLLMVVSVSCTGHSFPPEGTWICTSQWDHVRDGVNVPCSVKQNVTCEDNVISLTGVVSIGEAQWSETKKGTCHASGDELYGQWSSTHTVPQNDAARKFEVERLEGKSLADATRSGDQRYRARVTSSSDTEFQAVNDEGRTITCVRP